MSVIVESVCPKCRHMSWEAEMSEINEVQHCARCKESFIFPKDGYEPIYFYEEALKRLAIWKKIKQSKKKENFLQRLAKRLNF